MRKIPVEDASALTLIVQFRHSDNLGNICRLVDNLTPECKQIARYILGYKGAYSQQARDDAKAIIEWAGY